MDGLYDFYHEGGCVVATALFHCLFHQALTLYHHRPAFPFPVSLGSCNIAAYVWSNTPWQSFYSCALSLPHMPNPSNRSRNLIPKSVLTGLPVTPATSNSIAMASGRCCNTWTLAMISS